MRSCRHSGTLDDERKFQTICYDVRFSAGSLIAGACQTQRDRWNVTDISLERHKSCRQVKIVEVGDSKQLTVLQGCPGFPGIPGPPGPQGPVGMKEPYDHLSLDQ
ncbi:unnamed protein product [Ranitomeya imitator]|uniref:Uncharacterized protein n=1 Tax=Ranitomeya imitator TaxID=111125 RepID=A0ABN9LQ43_9NEOB|nr:unnamed protein product [Ranitomeya imitator]